MGRGDERSRGGDFGNRHHGHHDGDFVRRDARENLGAFGNGGILGEKPVEYFSDFGGSYQGQGNRRGEMMDRGGRRTDHLEREFMEEGGRPDRDGRSGNGMGGGMGMGGMGMGMGLEGGRRVGPFIHAPMGGSMGGGGGYPQMEEIGMREAMMEADQRMEMRRREEMEIEREAARFNNSGYTDGGGVSFGRRSRMRAWGGP